MINFFFLVYVLEQASVNSNGDIADIWYYSVNVYTNIILIVSLRLLINQKYHTLINTVIIAVLSWLLYALFLVLVNYSNTYNSVGTMVVAFGSAKFWLNTVLVVITCSMMDLITLTYQMLFTNSITSQLRILVKDRGTLDNPVDLPDIIANCLKSYNVYSPIPASEGKKGPGTPPVKTIGNSEYKMVQVANVKDIEKIDNIHIEVASNKDRSDNGERS